MNKLDILILLYYIIGSVIVIISMFSICRKEEDVTIEDCLLISVASIFSWVSIFAYLITIIAAVIDEHGDVVLFKKKNKK